VLALLHDAPARVSRLRAEIITRIHSERASEAFRRRAEADGSTMVVAYADDEEEEPEPPEVEFAPWRSCTARTTCT
jgi:hypothetical protein